MIIIAIIMVIINIYICVYGVLYFMPLLYRLEVELSELKKICVLGKGAYGRVCLVEDGADGAAIESSEDSSQEQRYALKTLSKGYITSQAVSFKRQRAARHFRLNAIQ